MGPRLTPLALEEEAQVHPAASGACGRPLARLRSEARLKGPPANPKPEVDTQEPPNTSSLPGQPRAGTHKSMKSSSVSSGVNTSSSPITWGGGQVPGGRGLRHPVQESPLQLPTGPALPTGSSTLLWHTCPQTEAISGWRPQAPSGGGAASSLGQPPAIQGAQPLACPPPLPVPTEDPGPAWGQPEPSRDHASARWVQAAALGPNPQPCRPRLGGDTGHTSSATAGTRASRDPTKPAHPSYWRDG